MSNTVALLRGLWHLTVIIGIATTLYVIYQGIQEIKTPATCHVYEVKENTPGAFHSVWVKNETTGKNHRLYVIPKRCPSIKTIEPGTRWVLETRGDRVDPALLCHE